MDIVEDKQGVLYALSNNENTGTMRIYRKDPANTDWRLVVTRPQMYGYTLCPTDLGVLAGVSNLSATQESGIYLLRGDKLVNIELPVTLQHVQFIDERQGMIYLYGGYYAYLYSFNPYTLVEGKNGLKVEALNRIDFWNNFHLKQFVLSSDCETAVLLSENGKVRFYSRTSSGYLPVNVVDPDNNGEITGENIIAGEYSRSDYNVYLVIKDDRRVTSVMEYKKGPRRYFVSTVDAGDLLGYPEIRIYAAGFRDDEFYFLSGETGTYTYTLREGQVFFTAFYEDNAEDYEFSAHLTLDSKVASLFITNLNQVYLGAGFSGSGANGLYWLYHQLEERSGEISFSYVNDDIEGITGFSFEVEPVWVQEKAVVFSFTVKEKIFEKTDAFIDKIVFEATAKDLMTVLADTEDASFTVHHRYDPSVKREVFHFEFNECQSKNRYLSFNFRLKPVGNSSPKVHNITVFKKIHPRFCVAEGEKLTIPVHGYVYDRTVTEVTINEARVLLERDGSSRYNLEVNPNRGLVPVDIFCVNGSGETARLEFTVEVVHSQNGLRNVMYRRDGEDEYLPFLEETLMTTKERLFLAGEYFGLAGAVAGYEIHSYEYQDGVESTRLVKRGLFTTIADDSVYENFGLDISAQGSGFTAGYFRDEVITLIPGYQQLRVYAENPDGHRQVFQTGINYNMPSEDQRIVINGPELSPEEIIEGIPIRYQIQLDAYEQEPVPSQGNSYVFTRDYEIQGEVRTLYDLTELLVKSYTEGLVFANGETEQTIQVEAGKRFRINFRLEMKTDDVKQDFYIGVIPKIPALFGLRTGVRLRAVKCFQNTNFIPDFSRLHPDNWTTEERESLRIPIRIGFNRKDLPVPGSSLIMTVNHETVIEGYLDPADGNYYELKNPQTGERLELSGLKHGRNRIEWVLQYRNGENTYTMSSSYSGRPGMDPYIFDYIETDEKNPTEIWFTPALTNQYYDAGSLPKLNIRKDKNTIVTVSLNKTLIKEDKGEAELLEEISLTGAVIEGKNELVVTYTEPMREPVSNTYTFLYDSLEPVVAIASWRLGEDGQSLTELAATVTEANFAAAYLHFDKNVIGNPEVIIAGTDKYILRWTGLPGGIKPSVKPVTVRVFDHAGKVGESTGLVLSGTPRPEEESAREIVIPLPFYDGTPQFAHESIPNASAAAHTKFAPRRFLPRESMLERMRDGDYLARSLIKQRITAGDAQARQRFGDSVAISGNVAIIGAENHNNYKGAAYIFEREKNGIWTQRAKLTGDISSDFFGFSVAISGDTAIVGTPVDGNYSGVAYVFKRDGNGNWIRDSSLRASDWQNGSEFGRVVAISGDVAIISSPGYRYGDYYPIYAGAAYIFEKDANGNWKQRIKLTHTDISEGLGCSIAVLGNVAVIGTKAETAYIYERGAGGNWTQRCKLTAPDGHKNQYFGRSVAVSEDTVVIGAYGDNEKGQQAGAAYIYKRNSNGIWNLQYKLTASDGQAGQCYGETVSISGNLMMIIASLSEDTNAAYIYIKNSNGEWVQQNKLAIAKGGAALSGNVMLIGAPNDKEKGEIVGTACFYRIGDYEWYLPFKYLVFKIAKDPYGMIDKDDLASAIRFEVLGYRQRVADGVIEEVNPSDLVLDNTRTLEGFSHYYHIVDAEELQAKFAAAVEGLFSHGDPGEGYVIFDRGALRIRYDEHVISENLVDVYATGSEGVDLKDILLYEPNYEDPSAPTYLHPALVYQVNEVTFNQTEAAEERTINFWLRLEDEGLLEENYIKDVRKRVFTVLAADGSPLLELGYKGDTLYLDDPVLGQYKELSRLTAFTERDKWNIWNMISLRVAKDRSRLEIWIDDAKDNVSLWHYEDFSSASCTKFLEKGVIFQFGPPEGENYNTGFFSVAGPFYIDRYLTNDELIRISEMSNQYLNTDREYSFSDRNSEFGDQQFQLRVVGDGTGYFASQENYNPWEGRGYGSLKASSRQRNLLKTKQAEAGKSYVIFAEAGDAVTTYMTIRGGRDNFTLVPNEGRIGRYRFGNKDNSNYGLEQDRWYSVSGHVIDIGPQTTARLVLRINGQEQSWPLQQGPFHFIYDNTQTQASPIQVQMYIESDGSLTLGHDLSLNAGNYTIKENMGVSASKTLFPFGLSGTVHFWYKPLNANPDGFVNYEAVLFDSELIKIWTELDCQGDAVFVAGIKNSEGQVIYTVQSSAKVEYRWQYLQVSYNFTNVSNVETNVVHFYVNGNLAGSLEGIRITPFGSLTGEMPAGDNVWLGCDQNEAAFAQGWLDQVVLNKYYQHEKFTPCRPAVLKYNETEGKIDISLEDALPEPDAIRYRLSPVASSFQEEGDGFPVAINGKPAGRYRLVADLVINGHNYREIFFFNLDTRPRFILQERTPFLFIGTTRDLQFKFKYDDSHRFAEEEIKYAGLAARITYREYGSGAMEETCYMVQDFREQDPGKWLLGREEAGGAIDWTPLSSDNAGLLELVFPDVTTDGDLRYAFKYFYFTTGFSDSQRFDNLPAVDQEGRIPTAKLDVYIMRDGEGNEYKLEVDITGGHGGVLDAAFHDIELGYKTIHDETGAIKTGHVNISDNGNNGRIALYYDDILHWHDETPHYGIYSCILQLMYEDTIYLETEPMKLEWREKQEDVGTTIIQNLEIVEFSLLYIDDLDLQPDS